MDARDETINGADKPPSQDELLAMAYADGELSTEDALHFETRLSGEPALTRLLAEHHALDVLARRIAPPEPADHEWSRLKVDPLFRASASLGWSLVIAGAAFSFALAIWGISTNEALSLWQRVLILGSLLGFLLLFVSVLWRRVRSYPLDPYRHVQR